MKYFNVHQGQTSQNSKYTYNFDEIQVNDNVSWNNYNGTYAYRHVSWDEYNNIKLLPDPY